MPAIRKIVPPCGREYWDSLDHENLKQVLEAVKEEFNRPEPADQLHYCGSGTSNRPVSKVDIRINMACFRDCQIFLLRGAFVVEGQGRLVETGCSYVVRDEVWIGLCGNTTIVVMEEGEQKGVCRKQLEEQQDRMRAELQAPKKLRKKTDGQCTPM